jgi:V8-like Glu-specific endopeptidase
VHSAIPRGLTADEYRASVLNFWTRERMASAKPLLPRLNNKPKGRWMETSADQQAGRVIGDTTLCDAKFPTKPNPVGRAFFSYGDVEYWCSASVIDTPNGNTVLSAGHCVFDTETNQTATEWMFVPNYNYTSEPLGRFVAHTLLTNRQWISTGDFDYDVSMALLTPNVANKTVQSETGAFDLALSAARTAPTIAFGYPGNIKGGETMSCCDATTLDLSGGIGFTNPLIGKDLAMVCNMQGGSSGGPWVRNYNSITKQGQVASLTSFSIVVLPGVLFGPHLTQANTGALIEITKNA